MQIKLNVNGSDCFVEVDPDEKLTDTLREKLGFVSVKKGCENGDCGACTILVDGEAVASCIYPSFKARGKKIQTIEAFSVNGQLHPLQQEFKKAGAFQCGFCSTGMTLSVLALLQRNDNPSEKEIREAIYGNLCRCTGYVQIVEAVLAYVDGLKREHAER